MKNRICLYSPPFSYISSYREIADCACDFGVGAVEGFSNFEFSTPDIAKAEIFREYADETGITIPCFSVFCDISAAEYSVVLEKLKGYADVAKALGSPYFHHTIVGEVSCPSRVLCLEDELFEKGVSLVREVYDYAESIGIKAVYEEQGYIFNGYGNFERFLSEVNRNVGVVADFGNIYQTDGTALEFLKRNIKRIVHVHVKDVSVLESNESGEGLETLGGKYMHPAPCGYGDAGVKECIGFLEQNGYRGFYSIEQAATGDNPDSLRDVIKLISEVIL